jgi:unspecific monooxygenase
VFVLSLAAQRDTNGWGSAAEAFDPDRFSPENLRNHPDRFFGPWGTGPRSCIGRAFAFQESILMVSKIVSAFDLRLDGDAGELEMRERGTLRPAPFQIRVSQRTEAKV